MVVHHYSEPIKRRLVHEELGIHDDAFASVQLPAVQLTAVQLPLVQLTAVQLPAVQLTAVQLPVVQLTAVQLPAVQLTAVDTCTHWVPMFIDVITCYYKCTLTVLLTRPDW